MLIFYFFDLFLWFVLPSALDLSGRLKYCIKTMVSDALADFNLVRQCLTYVGLFAHGLAILDKRKEYIAVA